MKIAQIAPIIESVPPKKYGGTERVIHALTEELVKRGHDVTLFASGDSITKAKLVSVTPNSLRELNIKDVYNNFYSLVNVSYAYQSQHQFDIIHDHNSQNNPISLPLANTSKTPVVMTVHGPLNGDYGFESAGEGYEMYELYNRPYLVTISNKQRMVAPHLNFAGTVYHGLNMSNYPFQQNHEGYLLFVGRIHIFKGTEEKGLLNAIEIAERLKMPLKIAAKLDTTIPEDVAYFKAVIEPRLSKDIVYLGEVEEDQRNELMSKAVCLLHTINFEEPFGLTLIEAMSCGCPVVAFNKGSIPEIVVDGKTGFVVRDISGAINAVKVVDRIDRSFCRKYSLEKFGAVRMAADYEKIYTKILNVQESIKVSAKFVEQFISNRFSRSLSKNNPQLNINNHISKDRV